MKIDERIGGAAREAPTAGREATPAAPVADALPAEPRTGSLGSVHEPLPGAITTPPAAGGQAALGMPRRKVTVVLPTYNEAENLGKMVRALLAVEPPVDILVVDDNSPDGTGAIADALAKDSGGRVSVVHRKAKTGLGDAYLAGFRRAIEAGAERVFEMDADFSHPVEALPEMIRLAEEYDVVVGSRYTRGGRLDERWSLPRRLLSRLGNVYARAVTGLRVRDTTAGFKCFRREALERLPLERVRSQGYNFQIEMALRCQTAGLRVVEHPIYFRERDAGASKMTPAIAVEALWRLWQLRFLVK